MDGGNHPFGRVRLRNRGWRYRVFRFLRFRRIDRRESREALIDWPRGLISAAEMTSPLDWVRNTTPVVFEPGLVFKRKSGITGFSIFRFRTIVKGKRRNTAALPFLIMSLARAGEVGARRFLFWSMTATFMTDKPFRVKTGIAPVKFLTEHFKT